MFNVLLQVLDDGRLTDGHGRTIDFRNTLIILTSNLGSEFLAAQLEGGSVDAVREQVMEVVRRAFRPSSLAYGTPHPRYGPVYGEQDQAIAIRPAVVAFVSLTDVPRTLMSRTSEPFVPVPAL